MEGAKVLGHIEAPSSLPGPSSYGYHHLGETSPSSPNFLQRVLQGSLCFLVASK